MTKEEAKYIIDALDAKGKARDAKGRFVSKEQIELARKTLEATEATKKSLGNVTQTIKQQNAKLDAVKNLQELQKDGQKELAKDEKKLLSLQQKAEEDRADDHKEQVEKQEKLVEQGKKTVGELKNSITNQVEGLNNNQKRVLKLDEQKEELQELKTLLESQGQIAEKSSEYRKKSLEIAEEEYRLKKATPGLTRSQRKELEKERQANIKKDGTMLKRGFAGIRLGIMGLTEKFGAGAMSIGKALLTLFGLGALLLFLKSEAWQNLRDFLKDPSWAAWQGLWAEDSLLRKFFVQMEKFVNDEIWGDIAKFWKTPNWDNFIKIFTEDDPEGKGGVNGLAIAITLGIAAIAAFMSFKLAAVLATITGLKWLGGKIFGKGKGPVDKVPKTKPPKPTKLPKGADTRPMREIQADRRRGIFEKPKGLFGRAWGGITKGASAVAGGVARAGSAVGSAATSALKTGVQAGKEVAGGMVKGAKSLVPKIAAAGRGVGGALKVAGRFAGPLAIPITAGIVAVEGVAAGIKEFKKSGELGKAMAKGMGGAVSSLTFGLVDKDIFSGIGGEGKTTTRGALKKLREKESKGYMQQLEQNKQLLSGAKGRNINVSAPNIQGGSNVIANSSMSMSKSIIDSEDYLATVNV